MQVENSADDGAQVAPVENASEQAKQETPQVTTPAEGEPTEAQKEERARDEKGRFQSRVNELTRNWRQTERERDALAAQLHQYQQQQRTPETHSEKPPAIEDFPDLNQWSAAVSAHAVKVARQEAEREFAQRQQQSSQEQVFGKFESREREYSAAHPDYSEAYSALQNTVRFHPAALEVIALSDHGPGIVHYLGQHLDVADRIARLPPHVAAAEIARLEAKVSAPAAKPVTNAPNPPPTLAGGKASANKDPDQMTVAEWTVWRNSQLRKQQGR